MKKLKTESQITRSAALNYRRRWRLVNTAEKKELRSTPIVEKLRQLAVLMASAKELGWTEPPELETREVRARWARLREAYHV
jgi:hypothetical protein